MDLHDRIERVAGDMQGIEDAIEALRGVESCADVVDILRDKLVYLGVVKDELHARIEAADEREEAALTREYWGMVV